MSVGQVVGAIAGGVVGFFVGGPLGALHGAALGAGAGGLIDPPKGPSVAGPRLEDLTVQGSSFGAPMARAHGTVALLGNVVWLENNQIKEVVRKKKQGGKGGGGGTVKTYTYSATFAVALSDASSVGPEGIKGIRRVWIGSDLVYNADSDDLETIIASNRVTRSSSGKARLGERFYHAIAGNNGIKFAIYPGSDGQLPDYRIEADMGVGNAPAFRGTAYIVLYDLPLEKYGNSLMGAQVKVELVASGEVSELLELRHDTLYMPTTYAATAFYMTAQKISLYSPQWRAGHIAPSITKKDEFLTGRQRFAGDISVLNPTGPIRGISDVDQDYQSGVGIMAGAPAHFGTTNGRFVAMSGIIYGLRSDTRTVYRRDEFGTWRSVVVPFVCDITVDDSGNIYCISGAASANRRIVKLSSDLQEIDSTLSVPNRAFSPSGTAIHWSAGVLYLNFGAGLTELFAMPDDLSAFVGPYAMPSAVASYYDVGVSFAVDAGIVIRAAHGGDGTVHVQRWRLPALMAQTVLLADVVGREISRSEMIREQDIDVSELTDGVRGYRPAGLQQIRACIAPLQAAYPFDLIMSGYQVKAVRRGKSSIATIPLELLDARAYGESMGVQLETSREMDSQVPRQLLVRHLDAEREYDINEQRSSERMSTQAVDVRDVELSLVLTADEAAGVADVLFNVAWLERSPSTFRLPPIYLGLEPADVITIDAPYGQFELRLTEINYLPDGRLQCSARPNAAASYTTVAVGGEGVIPAGTIPLSGDSETVLLDIPLLRNADDGPGFAAAMAGTTTSWPGGILFRSADNGQTWTDVQAWFSPVTMGNARAALTAHDGLVIDRDSTLRIDLWAGDLDGVTEAQMMSGINWAAYGADGRWELIRFADCELQSDGSYIISTLLRGLRGSEWATGLHKAGDDFVLLDDPDVMAIGADLASLNVTRGWRGVSAGQSVDDVAGIDFAYRAVNLRPLSPVHGRAGRSGADWVIRWAHRTRLQGSLWKTGIKLPLGEAAESYRVDIFKGASVVRTITSTIGMVTYTEAQQIEDFGVAQSSIIAAVYQMSASVGRGYPCEISA